MIKRRVNTMKRLYFFQKPLQPTAIESQICEFLEITSLVHAWVVRKLGPFDKREDDRVF